MDDEQRRQTLATVAQWRAQAAEADEHAAGADARSRAFYEHQAARLRENADHYEAMAGEGRGA